MGKNPELGFGIMRLPCLGGGIDFNKTKDILDEYMVGEFKYFDLHPAYMNNHAQTILRELIVKKYPRDSYFVANKMPYYGIKCYDDYEKIFQQELTECGLKHFDYYMLHALNNEVYDMHEKLGGFRYIIDLKEKGRIGCAGISFHGKPELLETILAKYPKIDFVYLQINFVDWENSIIRAKENYEIARKYNKKIIVMEPIKGGSLTNGYEYKQKKLTQGLLAKLSLEFVASLDGIDIILSGMSEVSHVIENRKTLNEFQRIEDYNIYDELKKDVNSKNPIQCTSCKYCERECPKNIPISEIMAFVNQFKHRDGSVLGRAIANYKNLTYNNGKASDCIMCGKCESKCPQKISIRKHLRKSVSMFEAKNMYGYTNERNVQILIYLLKFHGIKRIVTSPGAMNVGFVYSVQIDDYFEVYSAADERSAAYIACGLAEESGEPVVLTCTGATASRNYLPGLTEAYYRKLPVLAVTAAQPNGRISHNIPQVVDRRNVMNDVVNVSVELPIVHGEEEEWTCCVNANTALLSLLGETKGPAHINLFTVGNADYSVKELPAARGIRRLNKKNDMPDIPEGKIGIFCGAHDRWDKKETEVIDGFCTMYNAVVICDHTSNYKGNYGVLANLIMSQHGGSLLNDFDLIIHIGNVSGAYLPVKTRNVWRVNPDGKICDTFRRLTNVFQMEEYDFFNAYEKKDIRHNYEEHWISEWKREYDKLYSDIPELPLSNLWIAKKTADRLPDNSVLHLGILNSLRSWNYFKIPNNVSVYCNTGGFGIDGCVSSLIGASLFNKDKLYYGVVGDLAFFYDMNALGNRHIGNNVRLFVINNGCGTEFKNYNHLAARFGNATDVNIAAKGHYGNKSLKLLKHYAEDLGFAYFSVRNKEEYESVLPTVVNPDISGKPMLIEVFTKDEDESEALRLINCLNNNDRNDEGNVDVLQVPTRFKKLQDDMQVVLWGAGNNFIKKLPEIEQITKVHNVCDNNKKLWGKEIMPGIKCISPEELKSMKNVFVVITIEDARIAFSVANQLLEFGIDKFDLVDNWLIYAEKIFNEV